MRRFADSPTTLAAGLRAPVYRGPRWADVKRAILDAGIHLGSGDSLIGLTPCPYSHPKQTAYRLRIAWGAPDDDGSKFYVECGCGAHGPLADDPVEAILLYEERS